MLTDVEPAVELVGVVASCATIGSRLYDVEMSVCVREWMRLMLALEALVEVLPL